MSSKMLELNYDQSKAFSYVAEFLTKDASDDKCKDILTILSVAAFQVICENRGFTDVRYRDSIIAEISHHVEFMLRDFNEWEIDQEYGPDEEEKKADDEYMKLKMNLSTVKEDFIDEGNREIFGG